MTKNVVYHGTSLTQFLLLRAADFVAKDEFYIGENRENVTDHYAEKQAKADGSLPVTLELDMDRLEAERDVHQFVDGSEQEQLGQWTIKGPFRTALLRATVIAVDGGEIELPLDRTAPLPEEVAVASPGPVR